MCGQCEYPPGDNYPTGPEWEWTGKDGLTDKQREERKKKDEADQLPGVGEE